MKIGMITDHHCSRVVKESACLDHEIHVIARRERNPELYKSVSIFKNLEQFLTSIKDKNFDVWHVHNEPNWMVYELRKAKPNAKILMDYHDSNYWRIDGGHVDGTNETVHYYDEDMAINAANAFVVQSLSCKTELQKRTNKPICIVPSAVPLDEYIYGDPPQYMAGVCIEGGMALPTMEPINRWRDYSKMVLYLAKYVKVYIYSPMFNDNRIKSYYEQLGAVCFYKSHEGMQERLINHTWNLVGNWQTPFSPVWRYVLPNKLFEGIAAGLPTANIGCDEVGKLVAEYDIGINIQHPKELITKWDEHTEKRYNTFMHREKHCMENYINSLNKMYQKLKER